MNARLERLKSHIIENKDAYIAGVVGIVVGGTVVYISIRTKSEVSIEISPIVKGNDNTVNITTITETILVRRGHPGYIVRCAETGEVFASQSRAENILGIPSGSISKFLKGKQNHAGGYTFEKLGEAQAT